MDLKIAYKGFFKNYLNVYLFIFVANNKVDNILNYTYVSYMSFQTKAHTYIYIYMFVFVFI